jgi:tRNA(fMet)-specific endonuclease VapC
MIYLLDTNVCIVHLRSKGVGQISSRLLQFGPQDLCLCSIVVAELVYGALRSQQVAKNLREIQTFTGGLSSLPFDDLSAQKHAEIRAHLSSRGTPIGPHDALIAAIALANNLILVTHNTSEFSRIPNLKIEDWQLP